MLFSILHATRQRLQRRLTQELDKHPYYGSAGGEPITTTSRAGFDKKRLPAVVVHTPTGTDTILDVGQFQQEVVGSVQVAQDAYFFTEVYETPDPIYAATFIDDTYTLTIAGGGTKVNVLVASTSTTTAHDITEDEINTDIIPGVSIRFASFNNIIDDSVAIIKTYESSRVVGDLFAGRWPLTCNISVLHRRTVQAEEVADLVLSIYVVERDNFLRQDGIQARHVSIAGENDDWGDFGDEIYGHSISVEMDLEWRVQVSKDIYTGWNLVVPVSPEDAQYPDYILTGGSERPEE